MPQLRESALLDPFVGSLRQVVASMVSVGVPGIETAAEIAGLHVRTLQRRLEREGLTYRQLVDEIRFDAATRSLKDPEVRVTDIALDLGCADVSHFIRAFRRWAGVSPSAYRRHRRAA